MKKNEQVFLKLGNRMDQNEVDILVFDIFDTIILRQVHPEYVKKIFSKKLKEYFHVALSSEDIYKYRFEIEASICQENAKQGFDLEFHFDSFCVELFSRLKDQNLFKTLVSDVDFYSNCKKLEIEAELLTQEIDWKVIEIVKQAKQKGIPVYCLSDFYLPKEMLKKLFKAHGIEKYFEDIIVSSEYLVTKRSGRLYEEVLKKEFKNKKIIMIGDNEISDYEMAKKSGIEAFLIDRSEQRDFYQAHEKEVTSQDTFHKKVLNIVDKDYDSSVDTYFKEMGFTLYYFIYTLYLEVIANDIKHIFFLSREGEFLKKMFDMFLKINHIDTLKSHYLIVSRKSTFIASLKEISKEDFETLFRQYRKMSLKTFLQSLNFTKDEIKSLSVGKNWSIEQVHSDLPTSNIFKEFLDDEDFQNMYETKRSTQKNNLVSYIRGFDTDIDKNGITIVDAGWKGTIQDHIFKVFESKVNVRGYYIGLVTNLMVRTNNIKKGLVFDFQNPSKFDRVYTENLAIFEVLLGASHGSADHYVVEKDHKVLPITHQEKEEALIFDQVINPLQDVLENIFNEVAKSFILSHRSVLEMRQEAAKIHARMIYSPTKEEIGFFRQLYHFENFGIFEYSTFDKYKTDDKKEQLKHILKFIKNPKQFLSSTFWKAAALDDIGLLKVYLLYGVYQKLKIFKSLGN